MGRGGVPAASLVDADAVWKKGEKEE